MTTETRPSITIEDLPQLPPVACHLWEAREWLKDEKHWCKGNFINDEGATCAWGAVALSTDRGYRAGWSNETCRALLDTTRRAVALLDIAAGRAAPFFNDDPATTHSDILALFDRAIELAIAEGK